MDKKALLQHYFGYGEFRPGQEELDRVLDWFLTKYYRHLETQDQEKLKKFFNTSGLVYKDLGLKDKLPTMPREEQLALLASNGMLVKRPIVVTEDAVLVGFKEKDWEKLLQK